MLRASRVVELRRLNGLSLPLTAVRAIPFERRNRKTLLDSEHHRHTCRECAEICRECADDCERIGDMQSCVEACRRCAETCEKMAA
ncbi:four-helix bundle copper-binding protein [Neorhizobium petrolearium]